MSDAVLVGVNRHSDVGQDKSGRDVTLLAFTPEQTETLISALQQSITETGTLIRIATELRTTKDGKRQFPSSFLMVMADEPRESRGGGGGYQKKDKFKTKYGTANGNGSGGGAVRSTKPAGGYKTSRKQQTELVEDDE